jgi:hypothetical protein
MIRFFSAGAVILTATVIALATLTAFGAGPLASTDEKAAQSTGVKGTPVPPAPAQQDTGDEWTVIPFEQRTDVELIDIASARLFLPGTRDAAACEGGELDPARAEQAVRAWFSDHKDELPVTEVWDQTSVSVICHYPSDDFPGQVALSIGFELAGDSYVAPDSCRAALENVPEGEALPAKCIPADELLPTPARWARTIGFDPKDVLK